MREFAGRDATSEADDGSVADGTTGDEPPRPGLRDALAAFRYRNFTLFWTGAVLSNTGTWMQNVAVPYVVFRLTGSAAWLGVAGFLQFVPVVVVGPLAGSIADRFERRKVLLVTQAGLAVVSLALWLVWTTGHATAGVIIALVSLSGLVAGLNVPSWQAFVSELVPRDVLLNAVTLNSTQFNAARAFGPALGGLVLGTFGAGLAFLINAVSYGAVIVALLLIRVPRLVAERGPRPGVLRDFARTLSSVRSYPGIVACFVIVAALGALGSPVFTLLVVFADRVFDVGGLAYGLLGASLGLGSIIAAPFIAGRGSGMARSRLVSVAVLAYGVAIAAFGLAPDYAFGVVALVVAGGGYLAIASTLNTTIQLQVDEAMRGKVLAAYIMLLTLSLPIGALVQGWCAEWAGPRLTVTVAGLAFLAVGAWLLLGTRLVAHMDDDGPLAAVVLGPPSDPSDEGG